MTETCPRCGVDEFTPYGEPYRPGDPPPPAKSRVADIWICSACGTDEAMRDFGGAPPIPPDEWPVTPMQATPTPEPSIGSFGVGSDQPFVEWSRRPFNMLKIGGIWGIPRSGLVFTRAGESSLALTHVMPHDPAMKITPAQLHEQQASDFFAIQGYMVAAGIRCYDTTDTFEE